MNNIVSPEEMNFLVNKHMDKDNINEQEAKRFLAIQGFTLSITHH